MAGQGIHRGQRPLYFHIGGSEEPKHWEREWLNQVVWKFLADHTGHRIDVRLEHEMTEDMLGYQEIGGDGEADISIENYLADWSGAVVDRDEHDL